MGLYDEVLVPPEILDEIPDDWEDKEFVMFQSKDIQRPTMEVFKIEEDRLLKKNVEKEKVGTRTLEMGEDTVELPKYETVDEWWTDTEYHGSFEFHTSWPPRADWEDDEYEWYSYEAWFNKGELQQVLKHPDR